MVTPEQPVILVSLPQATLGAPIGRTRRQTLSCGEKGRLMAKQLRPLPLLESTTVEQACPVCGAANWLSLTAIGASDQYECQQCHAEVELSPEDATELRGRITMKFAELIRLG